MKKNFTLIVLISFYAVTSKSQNVGIGTNSPDASALFEVRATNKGMLIPRMTTAQMGTIVAPAQGLMIYNIERGTIFYYESSAWKEMSLKEDNLWTKNGANNIYPISTSSKVGIGTNLPNDLLHVFAGSGAGVSSFGATATIENNNDVSLSLLTTDAKTSSVHFGMTSNNFAGAISFNSLFNKKGMDFRVKNGTVKMLIDSNGYVGMSTLAPKSPLHVLGTGSAGGVLPFFSIATFENNANTFVSLLTPNANEAGLIFGLNSNNISGSIVYNNASTPKGFQFRTQNNVTQMVLDSSGNVGIGDITPNGVRLAVSTTGFNPLSINGGNGFFVPLYETGIYRGYFGSYSGAAADVDFGTGGGNTTGKINLTIQGTPKFSIAADGTAQILGNNLLEFGTGLAKEVNAGKIGYNAFSQSALTFVGGGTTANNRAFYFYNEGGASFGGPIYLERPGLGQRTVEIKPTETGSDGAEILLYNAAGAVTIELDADFGDGDGRVITRELQITGGSDLAEHFTIENRNNFQPKPGMLVSIDEKNEGKLIVTDKASDKKIVGVISGANGIKAGMLMSQKGTLADGEHPVALAGRVYVLCNNEGGEIQPGDFITSSSQKGYAMKVADAKNNTGSIIGKAMGKRDVKTGYVLVLVNLQ